MTTLQERKRRGEENIKKYRRESGNDVYAAAADAIADILLFVAQSPSEGRRILHNAERNFMDFAEGAEFLTEG
jgi:hypothetical protein